MEENRRRSAGKPFFGFAILAEMAEREGFEPPIPLRVCRISSAVQSTTLPPLRGADGMIVPVESGASYTRAMTKRQEGFVPAVKFLPFVATVLRHAAGRAAEPAAARAPASGAIAAFSTFRR